MSEWQIDIIYRQTGTTERPGGQQAGLPATDVRVTHLPTGMMAQCGEGRSQHRNRMIAQEMVEWGLCSIGWEQPCNGARNAFGTPPASDCQDTENSDGSLTPG